MKSHNTVQFQKKHESERNLTPTHHTRDSEFSENGPRTSIYNVQKKVKIGSVVASRNKTRFLVNLTQTEAGSQNLMVQGSTKNISVGKSQDHSRNLNG